LLGGNSITASLSVTYTLVRLNLIMIFKNEEEIFQEGIVAQDSGKLVIKDRDVFCDRFIDDIADTLVLSNSRDTKSVCYWIAYEAALQFGIFPSSMQGLYEARGRNEVGGFTVPAINLRTLAYDLSRAVFRSAKKINASAFIFEITRGEINYTEQTPEEYSSVILLAAIKENYSGPVFLQGDHFEIDAANYNYDKNHEITAIKQLIEEAVGAAFYNIDIDSSTLVELAKEDVAAQQRPNYETCAFLTKFIRQIQPSGIFIAVGGEIGEIGGKNSTPEELNVFMQGYLACLEGVKGITKLSIQTGAVSGGIPLPDGAIARANIDFQILRELSELARRQYGLSGCVQQGASTLPNEAFHKFSEVECSEIHLATQFQNTVYDYLPISLKEKIYDWLHDNYAHERKAGQTTDQFIYVTRKNAFAPFKKAIFSLRRDLKNRISKAMEEEFDFLFEQLRIKDTRTIVEKYIKPVAIEKNKEDFTYEKVGRDTPAEPESE